MGGARRPSGLFEEGLAPEEERRQKHPPAGVVVPRPLGIGWARTAEGPGTRMCEDAGHPVYVRWHTRRRIGSPNETETVTVYACQTCWPKEDAA
jgi:hypothetical protein